jgi:hypothetical protein
MVYTGHPHTTNGGFLETSGKLSREFGNYPGDQLSPVSQVVNYPKF